MRISLRTVAVLSLIMSFMTASPLRAEITESMQNFDATFDKDKNMHLVVTAEITAPPDQLFDALSHPELTSKLDPDVKQAHVVSQDGNSKIVELSGTPIPIPNAPKSLKIKVTSDQPQQSVKVESYENTLLKFQNEYKLSPTKDGKATVVKYTSTSNDLSKQFGMDIPQGMRQQFGLETFMKQLHRMGDYIEAHSKKVAAN